ncbi:hypothetical protein ACFXGE_33285, partial [Streptomyces sp. NPDC059378]
MSDLSPSPRDASRSSDSAADAALDVSRMSDALLRLEHSGRARQAWEDTRRLLVEWLRRLARLMRRRFRRRSGGGAGEGGYDPSNGPAGAAGQQLSEGPAGWGQSDGRPEERQREPGRERQWDRSRDREFSSVDQLVRAVGELPPEHRRAFEDTVLERIRTDDRWLRAYDRDVAEGRDSFLVEYANDAYLREVAPSVGPDPQERGDAADFTQGPPAYSEAPGREEAHDRNDTRDRGDADVLVDEPVLDHWDRFLASMERPAAQERDPAIPATPVTPVNPSVPAPPPSPDSRTSSLDSRTSSPDSRTSLPGSRTSAPESPGSSSVSPVSPLLPAVTPLPVNPLGQGAELHRPPSAGATRRTTQGSGPERRAGGGLGGGAGGVVAQSPAGPR